jgi:hypothetical protein
MLAHLGGRHALTEGVASVVRDVDGRLSAAETDALLLQGVQELVVSGVRMGGASGQKGGDAERAGSKSSPDDGLGDSRREHFGGFLLLDGLCGFENSRPALAGSQVILGARCRRFHPIGIARNKLMIKSAVTSNACDKNLPRIP